MKILKGIARIPIKLDDSSSYFLGIPKTALLKVHGTRIDVYARFFNPPYLDELTIPSGNVVLIRESQFPPVKNRVARKTFLGAYGTNMF